MIFRPPSIRLTMNPRKISAVPFLHLRDLRGKYRVYWHADYAEDADCSCICGICEICVENVGCYGTQITQKTQIVLVSAESAWEIAKAPLPITN